MTRRIETPSGGRPPARRPEAADRRRLVALAILSVAALVRVSWTAELVRIVVAPARTARARRQAPTPQGGRS